jgi:hypothetical protein
MNKNRNYYIRKTHRYLGLFIGLQFLGWTISGLYFAWNDIEKVRGNHFRAEAPALQINAATISPDSAWQVLQQSAQVDKLLHLQLVNVLGKAYYQFMYEMEVAGEEAHHHAALVDAQTAALRSTLSEEEAVAVASAQLKGTHKLKAVEWLEEVGSHHEIRGRHMPMWAVHFAEPNCTIYVSPDMGTFQSIRHAQWRVFDFLWMFHTMDFAGRDNFNNWLLKLFSVFGLFTVCSGFVLFAVSSQRIRKWLK